MNQRAQFDKAQQFSAGLNNTFLEIMNGPNPLTPQEIRKLIDKRPEVYGRFEAWASPKEEQ